MRIEIFVTVLIVFLPIQIWRVYIMHSMVKNLYGLQQDVTSMLNKCETESCYQLAPQLAKSIHEKFQFHLGKEFKLKTEVAFLKQAILLDLGWFGFITGMILKTIVSIWSVQKRDADEGFFDQKDRRDT